MSEKQIFEVLPEKHQNTEATKLMIPFNVEKIFGAGRVPVKVVLNPAFLLAGDFAVKSLFVLRRIK
jgi:hypothetical protein